MSVEKEVLSALKMKQGAKEDRKDFLQEVGNKSFDISDKAWEGLSEDAQAWIETAQKAYNADKQVKEFPADKEADDDERPARSSRRRDDDDKGDDDEKPARGRGRREESDDDDKGDEEDERPARGGRGRREESDDDERPARGRREESDDDERPARSSRREESDDDERPARSSRRGSDDGDDERPARRARGGDDDDKSGDDEKGGDEQTTLPAQVKTKIRDLLFENPSMSADAIIKAMKSKTAVSKVLVSDIKTEWRATVKHLQDKKALKKPIL